MSTPSSPGNRTGRDVLAGLFTEALAKSKHERGLTTSDRSTHSNRERSLAEVSWKGEVAVIEMPWMVQVFMGVPMMVVRMIV